MTLRIAIASGKGGTGKTTIATSLAVVLSEAGAHTAYVDCDVEEPNGHIFLRPTIEQRTDVTMLVPEVDEARCTLCGACGKACRYSAILELPKTVLTFPNLCHACGGCLLACPEGALREVPRVTGVVEEGTAGEVTFLHGKLDVGEAMSPPVIRAVLNSAPRDGTTIIDAPPGTSCPVIESVKKADVVLLVTEPTPFGLNDLKLAVGMIRQLGLPFGVAVNRVGSGDDAVFKYCESEQIPILLQIPDDRTIAQAYSRGELAVTALPDLKQRFVALYQQLSELAQTQQARVIKSRSEPTQAEPEPLDDFPSKAAPIEQKNSIPELVVISGKGGTGKTSIVASFFALSERATVADCDVDAADLHLVLDPIVKQRWPFSGGSEAVIDPALCNECGLCAANCRFDAIVAPAGSTASYKVDPISCEGCGVCADICPEKAATLVPSLNGQWFVSDTRHGPMVHARLGIAEENSGKLVSLVRREGKAVALSKQRNLLICDGSPGIGCPVIASIAAAHMVLVVAEPTLSGLHDLKRVAELCRQLKIRTAICINKADINPEVAAKIEAEAARQEIPVLGSIRYDASVTTAQVQRRAVVELGDSPAASDIRALWKRVEDHLRGVEERPDRTARLTQ